MRLDDAPVLSYVFESGPDDRVFDSLLLAGPLAVTAVAVLGRSPLTGLIATAYVGLFLTYVLYQGMRN